MKYIEEYKLIASCIVPMPFGGGGGQRVTVTKSAPMITEISKVY